MRSHAPALAALTALAVGCGAPSLAPSSSSSASLASLASLPGRAPAPPASDAARAVPAAFEAPKREASASECAPQTSRSVTVTKRESSTIAIVSRGARRVAYVADSDNKAVHVLDVEGPTELAVVELSGRPASLLPLADGRVLVTLRDKNRLVVLEPGERPEDGLAVRCERATYAEPFGIAVSADGARVAVTTGWDPRLMLLRASDLAIDNTVKLPAEPRGVLLSSDGETAYVAHMIGGIVSTVSLARPGDAPQKTFLRPALPAPPKKAADAKSAKAKSASEPDGEGAASSEPAEAQKAQELASGQGFALAALSLGSEGERPWPERIFVPMATSDPMRFSDRGSFPGVYGGRGGPAVIGALVAILDPKGRALLGGEVASLRDARPEDCILPRGIAVHNRHLLVACLGTSTVVELDARAVDPITAERRRFAVAPGPTGVAVDEATGRALVYSQWSGEINVLDLSEKDRRETRVLRLAAPEVPALSKTLARGRALFHATRDVRISFDGRACASCHPDGRADGLTWATPDGPRQTISLAGRVAGSGPFGWFGDHPTAKAHVSFTVGRLGGLGFESESDARDLDALMEYVASIEGPSLEGALVDEGEAALRERGRELFFSSETACSTCHLDRAADGKRHDVGSGDPREKRLAFDTPALRFVAGSAPYFHDGRYATLMDLLSDPRSKMGRSSQLSASDRRALAAYLGSL